MLPPGSLNSTLRDTAAMLLTDAIEFNQSETTMSAVEITNHTTTVPYIPVEPPLEKCNYYIKHTPGQDNQTIVLIPHSLYGGIPQNLAFNLIGWFVLMILFSLLRRAAGNYGRLALVRKDDQDDSSKWTQLFYAPDDVTGLALSDSADGPTFTATGNINRIVNHDIDDGSNFLPEDENDNSVAVAEEALREDKHFFAWIVKIFTLSDEKFLRKCGSDAVQYLKFQRHLIIFVLIMTVMCIAVILPINFQGDLQGDNSDFGHTTISNLSGSADWLWIHAIMTVLFLPLGILIMRRFSVGLGLTDAEDLTENDVGVIGSTSNSGIPSYEADAGMKQEEKAVNKIDPHFKQQNGSDTSATPRTLMISGIPSTYCTKEFLQRHFQEAYPTLHSGIKDIQPAYDVSKLLALDEKRQRARKARIYCENQVARHGAGQQMCPYPCGIVCMKMDDCCGECSSCCSKRTVDALRFYRDEEQRLIGEVAREKARVRTKSIGIAFITFATVEDAKKVASDHRLGSCGACFVWACSLLPNWLVQSICCCGRRPPTSSLSNLLEPVKWRVRYSPHPDDIYWENLSEDHYLFNIKATVINILVFAMLFFFTSPAYILSQLQLILNIHDIGTALHLSKKMNDFVPTLILWTIAALLPILVAYTDWWMGHWRRSTENLWIMRKVFFYLLIMVLILPSIGLTTLKGFIEKFIHTSPANLTSSANTTLMWSCIFLPDNGAFFINYVITSSFVGTALEFMRFSELFMYAFRMCFARSIAEYASVRKTNLYEFPFGFNYGWMLLIFALTAAYAVICPIITPFGLFYLIMKHGVDRYNLYYAYKRSKISKQIHATAVNSVIVSLLIQQLVLLFFNVIRGQRTDDGPGLPPRAIFSIAMFTIFLAMFVGQIFFHLFLGFSPIQYNPTMESPPRSTKHSSPSSRRGSNPPPESTDEELYRQQRIHPSEDSNGTELVYGEFRQLGRHAELGIIPPRDNMFHIREDVFGHHGMTNRRVNRQFGMDPKKGTKRYLPDVLRDDVFSSDTNLYPQPPNNSLFMEEPTNRELSDGEATFRPNNDVPSGSRTDNVTPSGHYGAINQQPKPLNKTQKRV